MSAACEIQWTTFNGAVSKTVLLGGEEVALKKLTKFSTYFHITNMLLLVLVFFFELFDTTGFVPSDKYLSASSPYWRLLFLGSCLLTAPILTYSHYQYCINSSLSKGYARQALSPEFYYVTYPLSFAIIYSVYLLVLIQSVVPHVTTLVIGTPVEVEMVVRGFDPNNDRKYCVRGIYVRDTPWFAKRVCKIDVDVLRALNVGDRILVSGKGGWWGVIPRRVDPIN